MVAALVRTIFEQPDREAARLLEARWQQTAPMLLAAEDDVLSSMAFPTEHWTRPYSTNVLEQPESRGQAPHRGRRGLP